MFSLILILHSTSVCLNCKILEDQLCLSSNNINNKQKNYGLIETTRKIPYRILFKHDMIVLTGRLPAKTVNWH